MSNKSHCTVPTHNLEVAAPLCRRTGVKIRVYPQHAGVERRKGLSVPARRAVPAIQTAASRHSRRQCATAPQGARPVPADALRPLTCSSSQNGGWLPELSAPRTGLRARPARAKHAARCGRRAAVAAGLCGRGDAGRRHSAAQGAGHRRAAGDD
jgi:hypothetical protein